MKINLGFVNGWRGGTVNILFGILTVGNSKELNIMFGVAGLSLCVTISH
jgi:hypothetical protein